MSLSLRSKIVRAKLRSLTTIVLLLVVATATQVHAQSDSAREEISIGFTVPRLGSTTISAVLVGNDVYLPVVDIFAFLNIKFNPSDDYRSIDGFFIEEGKHYDIDQARHRVELGGEVYSLAPSDFIVTESNLFLKRELFGQIFGLYCSFNFRALEVTLKTDLQVPAIRDLLREQARRNLQPITEQITGDRRLGLNRQFFDGAMLDWGYNASLLSPIRTQSYSLSLGGQVLYGELEAYVQGFHDADPTLRNTPIVWRYGMPQNSIVQQIAVANDYQFREAVQLPAATAIQITNTPLVYRKAFGTYVLRDYTEPNWTVELYINQRLADFTHTDAAGYYEFSIPIPYGVTNIQLKFYGPNGEERSSEKQVQIPFNFLPPGELQYSIQGGRLHDTANTYFSAADAQFGISNGITIGAGAHYFRGFEHEISPVATASIRLFDEMLLSGTYAPEFETRGLLNFGTPWGFNMEASYVKFASPQRFFSRTTTEERKVTLGVPLRWSFLPGSLHFTALESISPGNDDLAAQIGVTTNIFHIPISYVGDFTLRGPIKDIKYVGGISDLSAFVPTYYQILLRPEILFDHSSRQVTSLRGTIERTFADGGWLSNHPLWISGGLEYNVPLHTSLWRADLRLDLNFAQLTSTYNDNSTTRTLQSGVRGTVAFDSRAGKLLFDNKTLTGRGALSIRPFLDENFNDTLDANEHLVNDLDVAINTGRVLPPGKEAVVRIVDLEPYNTFQIKTTGLNFENLSWRPRWEKQLVTIDPNRFKQIDLPIFVAGEVMGKVTRQTNAGEKGVDGLKIYFKETSTGRLDSAQTVVAGEFDFLGLRPGHYTAYLSPEQLQRFKLSVLPLEIPFDVRKTEAGDIVENLHFTVTVKR